MSTILDTIIAYKRTEVEQRKNSVSIRQLEQEKLFQRDCYSLRDSILDPQKSGIIAEFKRKSPSKDIINNTADVVKVTQAYTDNSASGLSVLTDTHFFAGTSEDLLQARAANQIPILRKDFIIDDYQIVEAKAIGADVILLIAECLSKEEVKTLTSFAKNLGLEVLLELHSTEQLDKIGVENDIVGINNRDLKTFTVDIDRSIELAHQLPKSTVKIAESGISDPKTVIKMKKAGFQGFLMGEHFMKNDDPGAAFRKFVAETQDLASPQ